MRVFKRIFIHTTDASYDKISRQFFAVNRWHKNRWGRYYNKNAKEQVLPSSLGYYGGYTILIEPDGTELRYREDWEETVAVRNYNRNSLSIALAFDGDEEMPTKAQIKTLRKRLLKWSEMYDIPSNKVRFIGPHRLVNKLKTCYGSLLKDDWAVKLLHPDEKDNEAKEKKQEIEKQRRKKMDLIRQLLLKLKILLGKYIEAVNKRKRKK